MDECIHGFDDGLCAICFPPKEPERPEPAPAARRAPRSPRTAAKAPARTPGVRAARTFNEAPVDAATMRVYHATHLDNLARILGAGAILADAGASPASPAVDVSTPEARAFRRETRIEGADAPIAAFVPFFLSTDAHLWAGIRDGEADPRLAPDASGAPRSAADFVLLVSSAGQALGARSAVDGQVVVATADPALPGGQTFVGWADGERMLRRLALDDEQLAAAEYLVRDEVPLERVQLIAVANDRVRDRVRTALAAVGAKTRVAVYPPWFLPTV